MPNHFDQNGKELSDDGKTLVEQKASRADDAQSFMWELLDSVETLTGIAEEHGVRTLADLVYLHSAILNGTFIDHFPNESAILNVVNKLPSGKRWRKYVKAEEPEIAPSSNEGVHMVVTPKIIDARSRFMQGGDKHEFQYEVKIKVAITPRFLLAIAKCLFLRKKGYPISVIDLTSQTVDVIQSTIRVL